MFTVLGATGNTGSVVAKELLARGQKVRVLVRNPEKAAALKGQGAELVQGDVTDAASVARALEGADGAYLLVPPDVTSKDLLARNRALIDGYVQALDRHPVKHVVLLSSVGAHLPSGTGPIGAVHYAEVAFRRLAETKGIAFTFIRAAYFMENILGNAHPMKQDGVLPVFGGGEGYPFPMIATADIGRVAAEALVSPPKGVEIVNLVGPKEYSFADAAAEASRLLGRAVKAVPVPLDAVVPTFTSFGMSENVASLYREMIQGMGSGHIQYEETGRQVRGTVTLGQVLGALNG